MTYKRVLLKLSGEVLAGTDSDSYQKNIFSKPIFDHLVHQIEEIRANGIEIALVIGGGNIFRGYSGSKELGIDRATSDYMGMFATIINGFALQQFLEKKNIPSVMVSAIPTPEGEPYRRQSCLDMMAEKTVIVFSGGTGSPYFTTDSAAALRALEMNCDVLLKGTKVDGVYDKDPHVHNDAQLFKSLTYDDVLKKKLSVMDSTAFSLARDNHLPIIVFSVFKENSLLNVLQNKGTYTLICDHEV